MKNYLSLILFLFANIFFAQNPASIDLPFNGVSGTSYDTMATQSDGKVIIGGDFTSFDASGTSVPAFRLLRLNSDGTLDTQFNTNLGSGFNKKVKSIILQPDGKILVGGAFSTFNGLTQNRLIRLNSDGTKDNSLVISITALIEAPGGSGIFTDISDVNTIALQDNGNILVGWHYKKS